MLALLLACTPADLDIGDTGRPPDTGDSGHVETGDTDTGDSADTGDTGIPAFDCDALPEPVEREMHGDGGSLGPRAYHDVIFDDAGQLFGSDTSSLLAASYDGDAQVFLPGFGVIDGMDRLPDGSFLVTDSSRGELVRVYMDGNTATVATGSLGVYGITIGPDSQAYVAPFTLGRGPSVARVDPETGEVEEWLRLPSGLTPRVVIFNLDNTVAYIATIGDGRVYSVALDGDLNPAAEPEVYARGIGSWHDGLGIDACGNLYVAEYTTSGLYRVRTDGTVEDLLRHRSQRYGHGLEWGRGVGGWRMDALYQPQPYDNNTVREVIIGVPSGALFRLPG